MVYMKRETAFDGKLETPGTVLLGWTAEIVFNSRPLIFREGQFEFLLKNFLIFHQQAKILPG